jgi:hypothetical protein
MRGSQSIEAFNVQSIKNTYTSPFILFPLYLIIHHVF